MAKSFETDCIRGTNHLNGRYVLVYKLIIICCIITSAYITRSPFPSTCNFPRKTGVGVQKGRHLRFCWRGNLSPVTPRTIFSRLVYYAVKIFCKMNRKCINGVSKYFYAFLSFARLWRVKQPNKYKNKYF